MERAELGARIKWAGTQQGAQCALMPSKWQGRRSVHWVLLRAPSGGTADLQVREGQTPRQHSLVSSLARPVLALISLGAAPCCLVTVWPH